MDSMIAILYIIAATYFFVSFVYHCEKNFNKAKHKKLN